jgi:hypothetical protein
LEGHTVSHRFSVGQIVDLAYRMLQTAPAGQYEVRQLLPASDRDADDPRYRIKSVEEKYERVAAESDLTLTSATLAHAQAAVA